MVGRGEGAKGGMHLYRANWDVLRNLSRREKKRKLQAVQGKERQENGERGKEEETK